MAISVTSIGTNANTSGTTVAISGASVPAGALIVAAATDSSISSVFGYCADSVNGSYASITQAWLDNSESRGFGQVFYFENSAALSSAALTYTKDSNNSKALISALYATGIATTSALDSAVTASAYGVSVGPSSFSSGTPSQTGELFVGWMSYLLNNSSLSFNQDTTDGWTSTGGLATVGTTGPGTQSTGGGGNQVNAGGGTIKFNPSDTNAQSWAAFIVGFKAAPAGGGFFKTGLL